MLFVKIVYRRSFVVHRLTVECCHTNCLLRVVPIRYLSGDVFVEDDRVYPR